MTKKEKQYVEELERKLECEKRQYSRCLRKLTYYERTVAAARAYRILYKNLSWGPDGCLSSTEDFEFLDLMQRVLDDRLEELEGVPWLREDKEMPEDLLVTFCQALKAKERKCQKRERNKCQNVKLKNTKNT